MKVEMLKQKIYEIASEVAIDEGVEIYDVQIQGTGRRTLLRVLIDKDGGVTINDCEKVSKSLSVLLDVEDLIKTPYILEVSSPGIDRPLVKQKDFKRNIGKLIKIVTLEKINNQTFFKGRIIDVGEDWIRILLEKKGKAEDIFIPINKISKATLEIEF
ncbi:MAG: ribosome maturation factor RimP [Thermodesulfovibrionales bacterium]|nr:ribosome maturation factor RimP [Thermodesulfovibrionales bacterium]